MKHKIFNSVHLFAILTVFISYSHAEVVEGRLYGIVNMAYLSVSNGTHSFAGVVNNHAKTTRIGYKGGYDNLDQSGSKLQYVIELGLQSTSSQEITFTNGNNLPRSTSSRDSNGSVNIRKLDISVIGGLGAFSIGQGSTAGDGAAETDITGTKNIVTSKINRSWGRYTLFFTNSSFNDTANGYLNEAPTVGDVFNNFDQSRRPRIRYDSGKDGVIYSYSYSPSTSCSSSFGGQCDDSFDVYDPATQDGSNFETNIFRISTYYNDFRSSLAYVAYDDNRADNLEASVLFSISAKVDTFGIMYNYSNRMYDSDQNTSNYQYLKFVYITPQFSVSIDFTESDNVLYSNDPVSTANPSALPSYLEGQSYGLMFNQSLESNRLQFYYGYRVFSVSVKDRYDFDDISGYIVGILAQF